MSCAIIAQFTHGHILYMYDLRPLMFITGGLTILVTIIVLTIINFNKWFKDENAPLKYGSQEFDEEKINVKKPIVSYTSLEATGNLSEDETKLIAEIAKNKILIDRAFRTYYVFINTDWMDNASDILKLCLTNLNSENEETKETATNWLNYIHEESLKTLSDFNNFFTNVKNKKTKIKAASNAPMLAVYNESNRINKEIEKLIGT